MKGQNLVQVAVLAWIVTISVIIVVGPLINKDSSPEGDINRFKAHERLRSLNVSIASELEDIKNTTTNILICNACFLGLVAIVSLFLTAMTIKSECVWILFPVILSIVFALFIALTTMTSIFYVELLNARIDPYKTDFKDGMMSSLQANFSSDALNTGNNISNAWNTLFIDYECCGVNKVVGTTNDFDTTTWCTTFGTCQATASQIPKTCCKGVTKYDYQNASIKCHSSVSPGEYNEKGCYDVIKEEVIKERNRFDAFTNDILTGGFIVVLVMGFCSLLSLVGVIVFTVGICRKIGICRKRHRNNQEQNDSNEDRVNRQPGENSSESSSPNNESNDSNGHQASHQPVCENGTPSQTGSASFSRRQANNSSNTTPQANGETKETTKV